jgi:hypothetical protein
MNRLEKCSKDEFDAILSGYPRELVKDVFAAYEPPPVTYNDFTIAPRWPDSVVASHSAGDSPSLGPASNRQIARSLAVKKSER